MPSTVRYSISEYLAMEEKALHKSDYINGKIVAFEGKPAMSSLMAVNTASAIMTILDQQNADYYVFGSGQLVWIPQENSIVYPDAVVISERPKTLENKGVVLTNPLLIVEIDYSEALKFDAYQTIPSFHEYILISQHHPSVRSYYRVKENTWEITTAEGLENSIFLRSLDIRVPLEKIDLLR